MMKRFLKRLQPLRHPLWLLATMLFVWWATFGYKYQFIYTDGVSMQPTLYDGDWIILQKRSAMEKNWKPDRYDVLVITDDNTDEDLSKRVIGTQGDTIEIKEGEIYLNDKKHEDPFGKGRIFYYLVNQADNHLYYWGTNEKVVEYPSEQKLTVPEGYVWIIGDNRAESWYGLLPIKDIKGLAVIY